MVEATQLSSEPRLPRVTIQFCTQCKWMLRAAYYAQELLSTFSVSLGEVALQPATGGVFVVEIITTTSSPEGTATGTGTTPAAEQTRAVLWDRKIDGGFPEVKELKRRVRDVIQPGRDLGHVDRDYGRGGKGSSEQQGQEQQGKEQQPGKSGEGNGGGEVKKEGGGEAVGGKKEEGTAAGKAGEETGKACDVEGGAECEDCQ